MPTAGEIQAHIEAGRGKAAAILGQPYNVYRVTNTSNGDVIQSGNLIASNAYAKRKVQRQFKSGALETATRLDSIWFEITADLTGYNLGDIWILNDPTYGPNYTQVGYATNDLNGFCLSEHPLITQVVGGRLSTTVQVYRPPAAPTSGIWGQDPTMWNPVKCVNGSWAPAGTVGGVGDAIPVGLVATGNMAGDKAFADIPGVERKSAWRCYVPPLLGFIFREGDRIVSKDGAKFLVVVAYKQDTGATGSQLTLEKESPI